ncbi:PREDICTED: uncharacterized protein LOC101302366 [Fragaria vesca subsp. vesca]|uniref:uncharacterized protein LOC101302366 n=1 Tax=Fragaria vesca subsp. vesca TaxID=101020 RepID=UPI0002C3598B|nr:PREDICTED: uncharacterized protein LOC101302366 [Fragaria vesca subsp. vesca]
MDKRWITLDKNRDEYREGVKQFVLNFKRHARNPEMIICPCAICRNLSPQTDDDLEIHLMRYDVDPDYDIWCAHGEEAGPSVEVVDGESSYHIDVDYELPEVHQIIKKFLKGFDLGYEKIDACINDCCLFRSEKKKNMQNCLECNASRWKVKPRTNEINTGVPAKVLRYFPIIPRIKRMFLSASNSELLTWHSTHHSQDGMMRHPVDSIQWCTVDQKWPSFASEPRNLRFGLATDGFNPYKNLSSTHSIWPVILVIYNLSPNVCMSSENLMLSLLIPGPKQPGNDIDVYLEPLIDDLKELWTNGVEMYDAYNRATFYLKAILLWTINDFPTYGNLAGLTTKGEFACPVLPLRHNLDVMHIEKNVCESVLTTILDVNGKSKIENESRRDLELLELMEDMPVEEKRAKLELLSAPYTLTKVEKPKFCGFLPEGLRKAIWHLSSFFNELCQRVLDRKRLEELEDDIVLTLCLLERYFPPSFFDIMIHLTIHIGREAKLCGLILYPFERYKKVLKDNVKNHARPEGSIAENYLADACLRVHKEELTLSDPHLITDNSLLEKTHLETFVVWLQAKIMSEAREGFLSDTLKLLVKGPRFYAMSHIGFVIHGKHFHTIDANVSTADYGVHIEADSSLNYYGIIREILVLDYYIFRLAIFRCDWANIVSGVKKGDGFTLVNLRDGLDKKDQFILASHAKQVLVCGAEGSSKRLS